MTIPGLTLKTLRHSCLRRSSCSSGHFGRQQRQCVLKIWHHPYSSTTQNFELRPYQNDCIQASLKDFTEGYNRIVVNLPTGYGKTVIFSHLISRLPSSQGRKKVLVLAHRTELLAQAQEKIEQHCPGLNVDIEAGNQRAHPVTSDVVLGSVATLGRANSTRLSRFNPEEFKLIIVDEAHHSAANSYLRIIDYFGAGRGQKK